jgi:spermidine synthase
VQITIGDGKKYLLEQPDGQFDIVIHDVFSAGVGSKHMMTSEVFQEVKRTLKLDGIMVFVSSHSFLSLLAY